MPYDFKSNLVCFKMTKQSKTKKEDQLTVWLQVPGKQVLWLNMPGHRVVKVVICVLVKLDRYQFFPN